MQRIAVLLFWAVLAAAQTIPLRQGDPINLIAPATNADGSAVVFGAATTLDGTALKGTNLFLFVQGPAGTSVRQLTNYAGESTWTGLTGISLVGGRACYSALPAGPGGVEEVHVVEVTGGADRTVATYKEGCAQTLCIGCFHACVGPIHLTGDGNKVLYAVAREQPFIVTNTDGTGATRLPVYLGALAPSPQRVISQGGSIVFVSSSPAGPTFAAAATDVHAVNLDGTGMRPVTRFGNAHFFASNATISADGLLIAFESNFSESGPREAAQIWLVRADGSGLRRLSAGEDAATGPSISADGSLVTYLQSGQVMRARTADTSVAPEALTRLSTSTPLGAVVSEDGKRVAMALGPQFGLGAAVYRTVTESASDRRSFLSVYAPRLLNSGGVASAAGYGAPSAGSLISVYGTNLGLDEMAQAATFPLPVSLGDVSLLVNGQTVPLVAVTPWQINAQLPQTVATGEATFEIRPPGGTAVTAEILSTSPANFSYAVVRGAMGYTQAAAVHAGSAVAADVDHPAAAGETLEIYGVGLGITDPLVEAGLPSPGSPPARARQTPRVFIGGREARVTFAGLAPGMAGVYQVNAVVPEGLRPGLQTLVWRGTGEGAIYSSIAVK